MRGKNIIFVPQSEFKQRELVVCPINWLYKRDTDSLLGFSRMSGHYTEICGKITVDYNKMYDRMPARYIYLICDSAPLHET